MIKKCQKILLQGAFKFLETAAEQTLSYHLQRPLSKVPLCDQPVLVGDIETPLGQCLDDGIMTQQRLGGVTPQDEAARPAVEVCREQEAGHRRFQVLLFVLVGVEGVLQVCGNAVYKIKKGYTWF